MLQGLVSFLLQTGFTSIPAVGRYTGSGGLFIVSMSAVG